jgi:hypothetical protein
VTTVTVLIGNSDHKLTQPEWSRFCVDLEAMLEDYAREVHFFGSPPGDAPWQNAAAVFELRDDETDEGDIPALDWLGQALSQLARRWRQESIAYIAGETVFATSMEALS